jgi:NADH:ubiquinone oxidoreductase subunit F (NADH-binding)
MTAILSRPAPAVTEVPTWVIGAPRLLAGVAERTVQTYPGHLAVHGQLPGTDLEKIITLLEESGIAGRGGAGFPLDRKLRSLSGRRRRVIVNGSEGELSSFKDRVLMRRAPHLVLDGALALAAALRTRDVVVAVHDHASAASLRAAIAERPDARGVRIHRHDGGFVAGEARAVVRAIDGGPALPPGRRTPPTVNGDVVSNVETYAQLAVLLRMGSRRFADAGTFTEPGTTLLTISGAVGRPGVVEVPLGTPLGIVLTAAGAQNPRAVVVGGYHGSWIAPNPDVLLSREGLAKAGGTLGAGVLVVLDGSTCLLGEMSRVVDWLAGESANQCGPCAFGLPALAADVRALTRGDTRGLSSAFVHARAVEGRGACAHPDGAVRFAVSGLHLLRDETEQHLAHGTCGRPVRGLMPVGGTR